MFILKSRSTETTSELNQSILVTLTLFFNNVTSAPSMLDLFCGSDFSFDFSVSESDWLPESEPLPEPLLPDRLLLLEELELEPELEPEAEPEREPDSSSELLLWAKTKINYNYLKINAVVQSGLRLSLNQSI